MQEECRSENLDELMSILSMAISMKITHQCDLGIKFKLGYTFSHEKYAH